MDNDGVSDEEDQDIDGDGFNNTLEINCNSDPQKNTSIPSDIDNDGICDTVDLDIDGDGLPNDWEEERGFGWGDFYDVRIPVKQIREYELASAHAKEHKGVPSDEQLQQMLLIRAIACIPAFRRIENETPEMEACFKKGNLPETNWKEVRAARDWMNEEFMEIQAEANRLIEGWGAHIIGHAVQKYDEITHQRHAHEMAQREEMMKARRRKAARSQQKHDKEIERQQEVKRQRAADKMAEQILEEEQANSPRESPSYIDS